MSDIRETSKPKGAVALWVAVAVFVLGAIGAGLAAALGVHGFGRGMLLGAALACLVLGGVLVGLAIARARGRSGAAAQGGSGATAQRRASADWLPSRDGDA